jgi:hypothetical protein
MVHKHLFIETGEPLLDSFCVRVHKHSPVKLRRSKGHSQSTFLLGAIPWLSKKTHKQLLALLTACLSAKLHLGASHYGEADDQPPAEATVQDSTDVLHMEAGPRGPQCCGSNRSHLPDPQTGGAWGPSRGRGTTHNTTRHVRVWPPRWASHLQ